MVYSIVGSIVGVIIWVLVPVLIIKKKAAKEEAARAAEQEAARKKQEAIATAQLSRQRQYESTAVAQTAAKNLVKIMHDKVERADRDIRISEVQRNVRVEWSGDSVCGHYDTLFDFAAENLQLPEDRTAFICAVGSLATKMYKAQYPRDESGTPYSLTFDFHEQDFGRYDFDGYYLTYTASNGFYEAPKNW